MTAGRDIEIGGNRKIGATLEDEPIDAVAQTLQGSRHARPRRGHGWKRSEQAEERLTQLD